MRKFVLVGLSVFLFTSVGIGINFAAEKQESSVEVKPNIEARGQAELSYKKGMEAYDQGNYYLAVDYLERGVASVGYSNDPALAISPLATELYRNLIVMYDQLGSDLLKRGMADEKTGENFEKMIDTIQRLDKDPHLKKEIDDSLKPKASLEHYLADGYYNLGMIYDRLEKKDLKNECIQRLRSLGKNDWADEVEKGYKAN